MNKDQFKGRSKEISGKAKEVTGKVIGNKEMEVKGNVEKTVGKAQAGLGDALNNIKKHH